jgi:hypothetical protein
LDQQIRSEFLKKSQRRQLARDRACLDPGARSPRLAHSASPQRGERLGSSDRLARPARLGAAVVCHIAPGQAQNTCPVGAKEKKKQFPTASPGSLHPRRAPHSCACLASPGVPRSFTHATVRRWSLLPSEPIGPSLFSLSSKKKRQTTLACRPFRAAVALPCVSGVVYLYRDTLFVSFSAATECYHCVHIASLLHDFESLSYSLSTASC